jgi:STE24 endopeptidase
MRLPTALERLVAVLLWVMVAASVPVFATGQDQPSSKPEPVTTAANAKLDPVAATEAYLATLTPEQRARSDAYFEGGYWLQLWGFLYGVVVAGLLLATRLSARMRDLAARITRNTTLQTAIYWVQYLLATTVLAFPLTVYQGFFREHRYGLATQTFGPWLGDQAKGLLIGAIFGGLALMAIYAAIRRAPRTWWLWGAGVSVLFAVIAIAVAPVFIEPMFNTYKPLEDDSIRGPILRLARANGVPATDVFVVDASKQTTRVSANVAGFLGTERIALNDNLLKRCSLAEIETVMAHEIGHYALNHVFKMLVQFGVLIVVGFAFLRWSFDRVSARWGSRWGITGISDVAGLPLLVLLLSVFFFVMTPVTNTMIRVQEVEADLFALNAARQPDAEAEVDLKLGEYRKLKPGPIEELIFFDHPSGYNRILMAMRWKAENLPSRQP